MADPKKLVDIHDKAMEQFKRIQTTLSGEREQCKEDRRFCSITGAQWEGDLSEQFENKPKMEVNKVHLSVIRIINDYRNNKIDAKFVATRPEEDALAELCNGMFRADQHDSEAQEAYDNAFEEAVQGGMGAFRLRNEYEDEYDEDNDYQRICIEPIFDADVTVYFDLDAKRQDKSDARYAFVLSSMTPEAFEEKYPEEDVSTWPNSLYNRHGFDWYTPDVIYVAEYYFVEEKNDTKVYFETITGDEEWHWLKDITDEDWERYEAIGTTETRRRKVKRKKVRKYIMSGVSILEDCGHIAGREIPIVPVYGKRWYVENVERCMGHVRLAKDAQRLKNMQFSKLAEIAALSSVEKPILSPEQIEGHEMMWSEDNIKDWPYLLINPVTDAEGNLMNQGPISYTKPSQVPPAMAHLLQICEEDMGDILGRDSDAEQLKTHMSGTVVDKIHGRLDIRSHIFMSNFEKALRRCGDIWLSMARDIYVEDEREVKVIEGENSMATKRIQVRKVGDGGAIEVENRIEDATFDMVTTVGPSSVTQREAVVNQATSMMQYTQDPADQQVLSAIAMMHMNGDGMSEFREYNRKKLVKMQVLPPTQKDIEEMQLQPDQPSPMDQLALAESQRAEAEAAKNRADTVETIANAELKKAQAAQIQVEIQESLKPAPVTDDGSAADRTIKEEELLLRAREVAENLELKIRELDLRERELDMRSSSDNK